MQIVDDRTNDQRDTHRLLIVGTDSFLSGWGQAEGGASVAAWACRPDDAPAVFRWVSNRGDMKRVREVYEAPGDRRYRPRRAKHFHVYVVEGKHPALS